MSTGGGAIHARPRMWGGPQRMKEVLVLKTGPKVSSDAQAAGCAGNFAVDFFGAATTRVRRGGVQVEMRHKLMSMKTRDTGA